MGTCFGGRAEGGCDDANTLAGVVVAVALLVLRKPDNVSVVVVSVDGRVVSGGQAAKMAASGTRTSAPKNDTCTETIGSCCFGNWEATRLGLPAVKFWQGSVCKC